MRVCLLVPLVAVFGCAHQSSQTTAQSEPPPVQPVTEEANKAPEPAPIASAESKPQENKSASKEVRGACAPARVHFALDSDKLFDSEKPLLDTTAKCLSQNDRQKVTIVGNADERGSQAYNMDLGQRRADAVAQYLESKGAAATQVEAIISHGEDSPLCTENTLKCWQLNRRTAVRESCHM